MLIETIAPITADLHFDPEGAHRAIFDKIKQVLWPDELDKADVDAFLIDTVLAQSGPILVSPGGSTFNTLRALQGALPGRIQVLHHTALGDDAHGQLLEETCQSDGYKLSFDTADRSQIKTPRALVFTQRSQGGKRFIASCRGNVREFMTADSIKDNPADLIYLNANGLTVYPEAFLALFDKAVIRGIPIIFTLPTTRGVPHEDCLNVMRRASVILCNEAELILQLEDNPLKNLQAILAGNTNETFPQSLALVTREDKGAYVVTPDDITPIALWNPTIQKVSTLGCGDNAYGGFLAGLLSGLNPVTSAQIGMAFSSDCITRFEAQLPDPEAVFQNAVNNLAVS